MSTSIWSGRHVYGFDGDQVAGSGRTGGWSPRPVLYAEDTVLLDHQAFLLWLELVLGRSNAAVVAGVTTAAVIGGTS